MGEITEIDNKLGEQFKTLDAIITQLSFSEIAEFQLDDVCTKITWNDIVYPGIYLLEIKNNNTYTSFDEWVEKFKLEWEDVQYLRRFTPNLKKKRIKAHTNLGEWIPIYIGKSKNIKDRIREHIYKELDKTTFALKLKARKNLQNETFRLKTIKIEVENYDAIVPRIERELRNRINPIIGKQ